MTQPLPQLLGRVRRKRRNHQHERVERLAQDRNGLRTLGAGIDRPGKPAQPAENPRDIGDGAVRSACPGKAAGI